MAASKRLTFLKGLMNFAGIDPQRLNARWVSSAEAPEFVHELKVFIDTLKQLGPSPLKRAQAIPAAVAA
jgi:F420-non-reducing hydrogenase iron-sulfur subunit